MQIAGAEWNCVLRLEKNGVISSNDEKKLSKDGGADTVCSALPYETIDVQTSKSIVFSIALAAVASGAQADDALRAAEREAQLLYAAYDLGSGNEVGSEPGGLVPSVATTVADIYAMLDVRIPPAKIYAYSEKADAPFDWSQIPTSFEPGSPEDKIVNYIRKFEAGKQGYDSVWAGNRHPLPRRPTDMSVCEVRQWQAEAGKRQDSAAIGLFQIIGSTFNTVMNQLQLGCDTKFDQKTQDRMGLALLYRRGWAEFKAGAKADKNYDVTGFAFELAGEWAAFPAPVGPDKGFSRYRRIGGNRHLVELPEYLAFLRDLRDEIHRGAAQKPQPSQSGAEGVVMVIPAIGSGSKSVVGASEAEDAGDADLKVMSFAAD